MTLNDAIQGATTMINDAMRHPHREDCPLSHIEFDTAQAMGEDCDHLAPSGNGHDEAVEWSCELGYACDDYLDTCVLCGRERFCCPRYTPREE